MVDSSVNNPLLPLLAENLSDATQNVTAEEEAVQDGASAQSVATESVVDDQLAAQAGQMHISPVNSDDESEALASDDESEVLEKASLDQASSTQKTDSSGDPVTTQSGV